MVRPHHFLHEKIQKAGGETIEPIMLLVIVEIKSLGRDKIRTNLYETSYFVFQRQLLRVLSFETNNDYFHATILQYTVQLTIYKTPAHGGLYTQHLG